MPVELTEADGGDVRSAGGVEEVGDSNTDQQRASPPEVGSTLNLESSSIGACTEDAASQARGTGEVARPLMQGAYKSRASHMHAPQLRARSMAKAGKNAEGGPVPSDE